MGIFGAIKGRFLGRSGDSSEIGDIRSHVIGNEYGRDPYYEEDTPPVRQDVPQMTEVPRPDSREPVGLEPTPEYGNDPIPQARNNFREPIAMEGSEGNRDYDILDRLRMIEAQLSAIRSQTETINERLKNMEMRTGRRY